MVRCTFNDINDILYNTVFKRSWDLGAYMYYVLGACLLLAYHFA